ncbi:MAG TPA: ABC transporter ATP-binding protein [Azospirillaceae bacterium]|nr:ABC transporter ATP-binding protein [Azospirillaceae bacterium]
MTRPLLEINGLSAGYGGAPVFDRVGLSISAGEAVGLLGANGAGKSTLLRTLIGLHPALTGRILLDGAPLNGLATHGRARAGVGYVPEGRRVFPGMCVRDNLEVASFQPRHERRRDVERCFTLFPQLAEKAAQAAWRLSGGQQQMLALARALMGRPRLLLLDEPTLGLAPAVATEVLAKIGEITQTGVGALIAEQSAARLPPAALRAAALAGGRIIFDGPTLQAQDALAQGFAVGG